MSTMQSSAEQNVYTQTNKSKIHACIQTHENAYTNILSIPEVALTGAPWQGRIFPFVA